MPNFNRAPEDFCQGSRGLLSQLASDKHYKLNFITCPKQEEINGFSFLSVSHFLSAWKPGILAFKSHLIYTKAHLTDKNTEEYSNSGPTDSKTLALYSIII